MNQPATPRPDAAAALRGDAQSVFPPIFARIAEGTTTRERDRILPFEQITWLRAAGFGALRIPRDYGGYGLDATAAFGLLVDLAAADPNIAHAFRGHFAVIEERLAHPDSPVRDKWLRRFGAGEIVGNASSEPGASVIGRKSTEVTEDGRGGLRLDGVKFYTTGSIFADWIDVSATLLRPDGPPEGEAIGVLVRRDQPGVVIGDDWDGFGQRLTGTGTGRFTAVPVEAEDILRRQDRLPALVCVFQTVLLAVVAGITRTAAAETAAALRDRDRVYSHGNSEFARDDAQLKAVVGTVVSQARAIELLVAALGPQFAAPSALLHAGDHDGAIAAAQLLEVRVAETLVVVGDLALRATTALFDALGASAVRQDHALDRHWRNARVVLSHNPQVYRARAVGDFHVNGRAPDLVWTAGVRPPETTDPGATASGSPTPESRT